MNRTSGSWQLQGIFPSLKRKRRQPSLTLQARKQIRCKEPLARSAQKMAQGRDRKGAGLIHRFAKRSISTPPPYGRGSARNKGRDE
jgi:hypothetical protein